MTKSAKNKQSKKPEAVDRGFRDLMDFIAQMSAKQLYKHILQRFDRLTKAGKSTFEDYFNSYPFWGDFNLKNGVYDALCNRARVVRKHYEDFLWLHDRLADARSKNVLFGILSNWINFDGETLEKYASTDLPEYYHPDIFPVRENEVLVDVGAYTGDSAANFIVTYGLTYKRIYCYEMLGEVFHIMEENLKGVPNLELRKKAVGAKPGVLYVNHGAHDSSSQLKSEGEKAIEVVSIDSDIEEPVTFIKMDIEGAEQDALRGCERHICENHPHLAISIYHGYEDIIAVPRYIDEIAPGYKFYIRHHGSISIPTEFSLLAAWEVDNYLSGGDMR